MLLFILGRQPALGLAELEAVYGAENIRPLNNRAAALVDSDTIPRELGGAVKIARVIDTLPTTNFDTISKQLGKNMAQYVLEIADAGKVKLGISSYGLAVQPAQLNRTGLYLKNSLKRLNRSARVIPNKEQFLSSAQVIHGGVLSDVGMELVLIRDGDTTLVGRTIHEQDIEAYGDRDHGRPFRDAFVGMLPPKLAQIMINLATSRLVSSAEMRPADSEAGEDSRIEGETPKSDHAPTLLDPFCGTGVVLQEAALYGYDIYGTDLSEKMVRYTRDNIVWLFDKRRIAVDRNYEVADATTHVWRKPIDLVVCEGYLGQPLGGQKPDEERLRSIIHDCNHIMREFLQNIGTQIETGTPLCIGAPTWAVGSKEYHLPVIVDLEKLGFERVAFTHASDAELIYRREDQTTGRELLVLQKK